jgi:peroxiredoxin
MNKRFGLTAALLTGLAVVAFAAKDAAVNAPAPAFTLKDINGNSHSLAEYQGKWVVLEWVNFGCPFVKKHYDSGNMQSLQKEMAGKGVVWLTINSSSKGKQGNLTPAEWTKALEEKGATPTAVLLDGKGKVGKLYGAKATPHMFVIDPKGTLLYKGAIDDKPTTDKADVLDAKNYVRAALDEAMAGKPVTTPATEAYGCSVKY